MKTKTEFVVFRHEKIKSEKELKNKLKHNKREIMPKNADPQKTKLNRTTTQNINVDKLMQIFNKNINKANKQRKIRKDAVLGVELIFSATSTFFKDTKDPDLLTKWANKTTNWAKKEFPTCKFISFDLHLDEQTPHIHAIMIPINNKGRLSAKTFFNGRKILIARQTSYADEMKEFGLKRGIENNKNKHIKIKEYNDALNYLQAQRLKPEDIKNFVKKEKDIEDNREKIKKERKKIEEEKKKNEEESKKIKIEKDRLLNIEENHKLNEIRIDNKNKELREKEKELKKIAEKLREKIKQNGLKESEQIRDTLNNFIRQ